MSVHGVPCDDVRWLLILWAWVRLQMRCEAGRYWLVLLWLVSYVGDARC